MKLFFILFYIFISGATFGLDCPEESYEVKVSLPSLGKNLAFCQKNHNGQVVKHGPEEARDLSDKLIETKYYDLGKEVASPPKLPSISSKHQEFLSAVTQDKKIASDKFMEILQGLLPFFTKSLPGNFAVRGCKDYSMQWGQYFILNKNLDLTYNFIEKCDVKGKVMTIGVPKDLGIKFDLDLRNSEPFNHVTMHVLCKASPVAPAPHMKVHCETRDAKLSATGKGESLCAASYEAIINPLVKGFVINNIGGTIEFSKIFGANENYKADFKLPGVNGSL